MELQEAIEHALRGNAILFVGSGFSLGAKKPDGSYIKNVPELISQLCQAVYGENQNVSLPDVASDYCNEFGEQKTLSYIKQEFTVSDTTDAQKGICALNWRRIYTTNYDNVVEQSCLASGIEIRSVSPTDSRLRQNGKICVHFNGFVNTANPGGFLKQLRFSGESYVAHSMVQDEWFIQFREDVKLAKSVFFIGFSMSLNDIEISQLLFENSETKGKCFFIIKENPSSRERIKLKRFGQIEPIGTNKFWEEVKRIQEVFSNLDNTYAIGWALKPFELPPQNAIINGNDVEDLLLKSLIKKDKITAPSYIVQRSEEPSIVNDILQGADVVILVSDIADGKSVLAHRIMARLIQEGIPVFSLYTLNELLPKELDIIASKGHHAVVYIDNFIDYYDELSGLIKTKSDNITFLLTARRLPFDFFRHRINNDFGKLNLITKNCSQLDDESLIQISRLLDSIAGWGDKQGYLLGQKVGFLAGRNCHSKMSAILLALYENPEIGKKILAPYRTLANNKDLQKLILSIFSLTMIGARTNQISDIIYGVFGCQLLSYAPEDIRYYIDPSSAELVGSCNSIASFILRNEHPKVIVDVLCSLVRYLNNSTKYKKIHESLMTFGKIQNIFSEQNRFTALSDYYSQIQIVHSDNPLFWLQFAICKNAQKEFGAAKQYFDAAYSLANKTAGFNTFQLDNAYASFLLDRGCTLSADEAINDFFKAHENVEKELRNNDEQYKHYPYRTAKRYLKFYQKHFKHLIPEHQNRFKSCCTMVLSRIDLIPENVVNSNQDMKDCRQNLRKIVYIR